MVFYPRLESTTADRTIGIGIELYNTNDDSNLWVALEATSVIDTYFQVYRYDFASIISYGLGFFNNTTSTTQIVSGAIAPIEVVVAPSTSTGEVAISGTQINFNSDSFISNTAGGNSGNHLVVFVNGTEYKIKLENAS